MALSCIPWSILAKRCLLFSCLLLVFSQSSHEEAVDVARGKPIEANITCGVVGSEYYVSSEYEKSSVTVIDNMKKTCSPGDPNFAPAKMVDGDPLTFWQSTSRTNLINIYRNLGQDTGGGKAEIYLDLQQEFDVQRLTIQFGKAYPPGSIILYKSTTGFANSQLRAFAYMLASTNDCAESPVGQVISEPLSLNDATCQVYPIDVKEDPEAADDFEIAFDFAGITGNLGSWKNMRYLKLEFADMRLTLGPNGITFQHYTVRNIEVMAECKCNGHQTTCDRSNITGQYQCVCGGNTFGDNCETCLPFYNQKPFEYGVACEECNCFGHADTCYYDAVVATAKESLNARGELDGGGVCIDCRDNTTGNNCEQCLPYHYRPLTNTQYQTNPCLRCECTGPGIRVNDETGLLGDCVMNNDGVLPAGVKPGDCYCKANVMGSKCDTCKVGYYKLQPTNPDGCQECACNVNGTVAGTIECDALVTGNCPCKTNVEERRCDRCKDNFYGLSADNADGCTACDCDPGGAYELPCNKATGQCSCRARIEGQRCTQPSANNFYPDLHFINSEFENLDDKWDRATIGYLGFGYAPLEENGAAQTDISTPTLNDFSDKYYMLIRYSNPAATATEAYISVQGYRGSILPQGDDVTFNPCNAWCYVRVGSDTDLVFNLVDGERYRAQVTAKGPVKLDRVIALPVEYVDTAAVLGTDAAEQFALVCDPIDNDLSIGTDNENFCLKSVFSLSARYMRGAIKCECNALGSLNNECEAYGGQCACKPGVMGRQCDQCELEFYGLTSAGCKSCDCQTAYKICDSDTGQCLCPPLTTGRQCELCQTNAWKWNGTLGCENCNCDPVGSLSLQCNSTTGTCLCKPGVTGAKCDQCIDGYTGFSSTGCRECGCDADGSLSLVCSKTTGQCDCKKYVGGLTCNQCADGAFDNDINHVDGCLQCVCMGITTNCRSSTWKYSTTPIDITSTNVGSTLHVAADGITVLQDVNMTTINGYTAAKIVLGENSQNYWSHSNDFLGNLLGIYEGSVSFTVRYTTDDPGATPPDARLIIIGRDDAMFKFNASSVQPDVYTDLDVAVSMENIVYDEGENETTRADLLLALTDVKMVLIPASYYTRSHTSYIGKIKFTVANPAGLGALATGVEHCTCPTGYSGLSCETCSDGYRRANVDTHPYLGECEECECNNHATECHPETGACVDCRDNTQGYSCEFCVDGFFGTPTTGTQYDCDNCPCYEPRVINNTCSLQPNPLTLVSQPACTFCAEGYTGRLCDECDTFYYGNPELEFTGVCRKCFCNNNTDQCNSATGECLGCDYNTTGTNCERCAPGYFGNATERTCQPCGCELAGSLNTVCNHETGQCQCQPGVGGRICDACIENFYGYETGEIGCTDCACNPFGSKELQCNETGICSCHDNVNDTSAKCDVCILGHYGLPNQACDACACNATGSLDPSLPCELISGQCGCKPGVGGRKCDECLRMYTNYSDTGCEKCGECEYSLGNDTLRVQEMWEDYYNQTMQVYDVQKEDEVLQNVSSIIQGTVDDLGVSNDQLDYLTRTLNQLKLTEGIYNASVIGVLDKVDLLVNSSRQLQTMAEDDLLRLQALNLQAHQALDLANSMNASLLLTIETIYNYNTSAALLLNLGQGIYIGLNTSFESERQQVAAELAVLDALSDEVGTIQTRVTALSNQVDDINSTLVGADEQYSDLSDRIALLNIHLNSLVALIAEVNGEINSTVSMRNEAETLLTNTQVILADVNAILTQAQADYNTGALAFQNCNSLIDRTGLSPVDLLPVDTTVTSGVDLTGITSWSQAAITLNNTIIQMNTILTDFQTTVADAETRVSSYEQQAEEILEVYNAVKNRGQAAVDAVENYQEVVDTLEESYKMAVDALETMKDASDELAAVSVPELESKSTISLQNSLISKDEASLWNNAAGSYIPMLNSVNISFNAAVSLWDKIEETKDIFDENIASAATLAIDPGVTLDLSTGNIAADAAIRMADQVLASDKTLQRQVEEQEQMMANIEENSANSEKLDDDITTEVAAFQKELEESVQTSLDSIQTDFAAINTSIPTLDARIAALEAQIVKAKDLLAELEQPVRYGITTYEAMDNPDADKQLKYTEISLDFKYTLQQTGILFFGETTTTAEKVLLQIVEKFLLFEFTASDGVKVTITSPVELTFGDWFRVYASRYENFGQLSVTKLKTGGRAVSHATGESAQTRISIGSPLYVGGIPSNYSIEKVYDTGTGFAGCIYNVQYNGLNLPIWQQLLKVDSSASCCARPAEVPVPPTIAAVCFYGFGYLSVQMDADFSVVTSAEISIEFRTFSPNAVIFLVDSTNTEAYYGLYIVDGQAVLIISSGGFGSDVKLSSGRLYNDGNWYRANILSNITYSSLSVEYVDKDINTLTDVRSTYVTLFNLTGLHLATLTFGGQNPDIDVIHGPVSDSLAGCIQSWKHTSVSDPNLKAYSLVDGLTKYEEVDYDSCYETVISGLGVYKENGYQALKSDSFSVVSTVSFELYTYDPSGVVMFASLFGTQNLFMYIGLFNGDLFLIFDQGLGVVGPIHTIGKYLSDGEKHEVEIDFKYQNSRSDLRCINFRPDGTQSSREFLACTGSNSPAVTVDGTTYYGTEIMSENMRFTDGTVYIGGIPASIGFNTDNVPAPDSNLIGVRNLKFNGEVVDFFGAVLQRQNRQYSYLSGLPAPLLEQPVPPYSTTEAPPTTPPPTCAPAVDFNPQTDGTRFGDSAVSYLAYELPSNQSEFFKMAFSLRVDFRSTQLNGLIAYFASDDVANPINWFAVYLYNGYVYVSMKSEVDTTATRNIKSIERYNDGKWWDLELLRINNFMAVIVPSIRDYNNNGVDAGIEANLTTGSKIYFGGVPSSLNGIPFTNTILSGTQPFQGCIRAVGATTHNYVSLDFSDLTPVEEVGTTGCYSNVAAGSYFNDSVAFARVESSTQNTFSLTTSLRVSITIKGVVQDGVLFAMWNNNEQYAIVALEAGQIVVSLRNSLGDKSPTTIYYENINDRVVCDNEAHVVQVTFSDTGVTIKVDAHDSQTSAFRPGFVFQPLFFIKAYAAGLPNGASPPIGDASYNGCIQNLAIDSTSYMLTYSTERYGVIAGCPDNEASPEGGT